MNKFVSSRHRERDINSVGFTEFTAAKAGAPLTLEVIGMHFNMERFKGLALELCAFFDFCKICIWSFVEVA